MSNGEPKSYYLLDGYEIGFDFLDLTKTQFVLSEGYGASEHILNIQSVSDIHAASANLPVADFVFLRNITILENAPDFFSLYCIQGIGTIYVISERLKEVLEKEKITGMEYINI